MNKFSNFTNTKEPSWRSDHLPDEHDEHADKIPPYCGQSGSIWCVVSVGVPCSMMAGSSIVAEGLAFTVLLSLCVGFSIEAIAVLIATFRE